MKTYKPKTVEYNGHLIRRVMNGNRVYWTTRGQTERIRHTTLQAAKASLDVRAF
jgi:hypothetical protein